MGKPIMRLFVLPLLIAGLLPTLLPAQELDFMKMMRSDINRRYHQSENRLRYWTMWDGNGASSSVRPFVFDDDFRQGIGLTDEQHEQLKFMYSRNGGMGHWYRSRALTNPELAALLEESDRLQASMRGDDPYGERLTEEEKQAIIANSEKTSAIYRAETQKDVENILTPEQMQVVREYELAMMGEIPILNPSMFECLDLTEEQKAQMASIKQAMEQEFEAIVEELVQAQDALDMLEFDLFDKLGIKFDENGIPVDENGKSLMNNLEALMEIKKKSELIKKEMTANTEARMKQINERAGGFMRGFKFEMFDVLTDEQMERMQRIIDNPPEFIKKRRDQSQKERAGKEKKDKWQPGPDSWKPGDPIPEEYLQQRQERRFPRRT